MAIAIANKLLKSFDESTFFVLQYKQMFLSLDQAASWLMHYKYLALFPLAVLEGPIITVITGFFSSLGYINFFLAYIVIVIGDLVGDAFHYALGRFGREKFIDKWGRYIGVNKKQIESIEKQFDKRGSKLLFIGKMAHGIGGAFLVAAGMIKMPFDKFIFSNFLATLVKSFILLLAGFYFGRALDSINSYLEKISLILIGIAGFSLLIYFLYFRKNKITV